MKKTFSIFIICLVVYNTIGFIAQFRVILREWHHQVNRVLSTQANSPYVKRFTFNKKDFDDDTKEFELNGRFYDIIKIEDKNDSTLVICYDDATETQLYAYYRKQIEQNTQSGNDSQTDFSSLFKNLLKDFSFEKPVIPLSPTPSVEMASREPISRLFSIKTFFLSDNLKPPQAISA